MVFLSPYKSAIILLSEYLSCKVSTHTHTQNLPFQNPRLLLRFIFLLSEFLRDFAFAIVLCAVAIQNLIAAPAFPETRIPLSFEPQKSLWRTEGI